jgi:hypothetical protein
LFKGREEQRFQTFLNVNKGKELSKISKWEEAKQILKVAETKQKQMSFQNVLNTDTRKEFFENFKCIKGNSSKFRKIDKSERVLKSSFTLLSTKLSKYLKLSTHRKGNTMHIH